MEDLIIRKPTVNDVPQILELINGYANAQMMLNKSHYRIYTTLQNFIVAEHDNKICGCCALNILWSDLGEICSLPRIITLTYQDKFFEKMGFVFSDKNAFPRKLWRECLECPKLEHCDELAYVLELHYE